MDNKKKEFRLWLVLLIVILISVIGLNLLVIRKSESERIDADGQMRLSSIAGRVQNSMYQSECLLDSLAMKTEQIIAMGGDIDSHLTEYLSADTIAEINDKSSGGCFSAYAAYNGKLYIDGFVPDDNFILEERTWYVEAKKRRGAINVSDPYIDANTGRMCYTISKLLPDGNTVVGLDFNLTAIQDYIEEMDSNSSGTSMIVNGKGMIVGHSDSSFVGKQYRDFESYNELVNRVFMLYGDSFEYSVDGEKYTVFSDKTNYDWYLVVSLKRGFGDDEFSGLSRYLIVFMILFSVAVVVFFIINYQGRAKAENALFNREAYILEMSEKLKNPISRIINRSDVLSGSDNMIGNEIGDSARELDFMLDDLVNMPERKTKVKKEHIHKKIQNENVSHKKQIILIAVVLIITSTFAVILNTDTQVKWGNTKMQKETEQYFYQVQDWITNNRAVLDVIADSISAQPGFADDYDSAVDYLDDIVSKYDDISVAYLCNPEWEHTVLMNNRWEPESSWHVEERQWYIDTLLSTNNFSIAAPYLDEQTGLYCTTLSKVVYDPQGNFIGLLGIDYYLDKLVGILGESYTSTGYAFLTDINGSILNHPYAEYQMKPDYSQNAAELCYRTAFYNDKASFITDYDGRRKVCLTMAEKDSGFTVVVVKNAEEIYGNAIISDIIYILVFAVCIIIVLVIMRRLTEWQQRVNSELKEAAENAISAGKAKNNFLANMSHEIRTPINAVLGMNEMILRESGDKQILEYSENIQSAGRTLLSLINEILDFSKIESGKMEIVPVEYDMGQLINDLINMIKTRAEKKNLSFITEIDENIPAVLYGDDVRIRQIITNILTNAVKYTQKGNVRLKMNLIEMNDGMAKIEVSVSDTGMGIKEEDMSKLYTSFQRLDQEKNRNIEGTGLGITIVQKLLKMMDSELNVASVYGMGSTFSFIISQKIVNAEPMGISSKRYSKTKAKSEDHQVKTAPDAKILIVDDNEMNILVAKGLLKRTLVKTDTATSGKQCIEMLRDNMYDIVFLDHMMPEMDGIETLAKIKEEQLAAGTAFIALTANAISGAKQTYIDAGFDDYLSKPINSREIEDCLFRYIDNSLIQKAGDSSTSSDEAESDNAFSEIGSAFDIEYGLKKADGDVGEYMNRIYDFCDNNRCNDLDLDHSINDYASYQINIKKAISEAELIGLTELAEKAQQLGKAASEKNNSYISSHHSEVMKLYRNAVDNIETAAEKYFSERNDTN